MTGEWLFWFCVAGQGRTNALFLIVTLGHLFWFKMVFFFFFLLGKNIKRRKKRKQTKTRRYHYPPQALSLVLDYKVFSLHCFCLIVGPGRHFHFTWPFFFPSHTQCLHCHQTTFVRGCSGVGLEGMGFMWWLTWAWLIFFFSCLHLEQCQLNSQIWHNRVI